MSKPILCLDFDGVCHLYTSGWINAWTIPDPPVPGLFKFLEEALKHFRVAIFSSRGESEKGRLAMMEWFRREALKHFVGEPMDYGKVEEGAIAQYICESLEFPVSKPAALVTLDDRAVTFIGVWPDVALLKQFQPWTKWRS